jgi:hypothetical protein
LYRYHAWIAPTSISSSTQAPATTGRPPHTSTVLAHLPPPSLAVLILKLLLELTVYDIVIYVMLRTRPSLDTPEGDTLFDPHLDRLLPAAFFML